MRAAAVLLVSLITSNLLTASDGKHLITEQWVIASEQGSFNVVVRVPGEAIQGDHLRVSVTNQAGQAYRGVRVADQDFAYSFVDVPEGIYTLLAVSDVAVACYAFHVVDGSGLQIDPQHNTAEVYAATIPQEELRRASIRYMPPTVGLIPQYDQQNALTVAKALDQSRLTRVSPSDNGLSGRVYRAGLEGAVMSGAAETNVLVFQNGALVEQTATNGAGAFRIPELAAGQYSLLAIGRQGVGITWFELVGSELTAGHHRSASPRIRLVSMQQPEVQPQLELQLAPIGLDSPVIQQLLQQPGQPDEIPLPPEPSLPVAGPAPALAPTGGVAGGGVGGSIGGSAGGGRGIGGILGLAGAGIGIAAASSDDDGGFAPPPVTSPLNP